MNKSSLRHKKTLINIPPWLLLLKIAREIHSLDHDDSNQMTTLKHRWCDHQLRENEAASGHKRGEVKASLCTATMERKFSVCVVAAIQSAATSGHLVRKTGDGWWQLFVNNLISGSSAVSLFHPPHFFVNMFKLLRLLSMHGFSSFSKVPTVDSRRSRPRGVA